jgi:hypothetical protein
MFTRLGEHQPPEPQSESTVQLPVEWQTFGSLLVLEDRHSHAPPSQPVSAKHWS